MSTPTGNYDPRVHRDEVVLRHLAGRMRPVGWWLDDHGYSRFFGDAWWWLYGVMRKVQLRRYTVPTTEWCELCGGPCRDES